MKGIVLAGGENRRMGTDKAFLKVAGVPLIEHVLRSMKDVFQDIIVVTNAPERYAAYDVQVVSDALAIRGPLTGIYSGLLQSSDEYNFVVACDMPFLNSRLIAYIAGLAAGHDVVVPSIGGQPEPLHAVYRRELIAVMKEEISRDRRQIQGIFCRAKVRYVTEHEIDRFDPARKSFKNLNTPEEYEEAACADWERRS